MQSIVCGQCGVTLSSVDQVIQHVETAHPTQSRNQSGDFLCPGCPGAFHQILQLRRHLSEAHGFGVS